MALDHVEEIELQSTQVPDATDQLCNEERTDGQMEGRVRRDQEKSKSVRWSGRRGGRCGATTKSNERANGTVVNGVKPSRKVDPVSVVFDPKSSPMDGKTSEEVGALIEPLRVKEKDYTRHHRRERAEKSVEDKTPKTGQ